MARTLCGSKELIPQEHPITSSAGYRYIATHVGSFSSILASVCRKFFLRGLTIVRAFTKIQHGMIDFRIRRESHTMFRAVIMVDFTFSLHLNIHVMAFLLMLLSRCWRYHSVVDSNSVVRFYGFVLGLDKMWWRFAHYTFQSFIIIFSWQYLTSDDEFSMIIHSIASSWHLPSPIASQSSSIRWVVMESTALRWWWWLLPPTLTATAQYISNN